MAFDNLLIRTRSVSKFYDEEQVLSDFNLDVWKGSITGILGSSGSGKTTALRLIAVSYTHLTLPTNREV